MRNDILEKREQILSWINLNKSKAYMCRELSCKQDTLNRCLKLMGISYVGNMAGVGVRKSRIKTEDIINNRVKFNSSFLKKRLVLDGLLEDRCIGCENSGEWMGKPITLEIDHINGNDMDNRIENLRILCPNCHSQTPTFRKKKSYNGVVA